MAESQDKGNLLEDIVAKIHQANGLRVSTRVQFPSLSDPTRKREIDVLLEASVGPYPIRIPMECKNWGKQVGIDLIDAYQGKLADIGLNASSAIYVSANGYDSGAVARAKDLGIVLLGIHGLSPNRLNQEVFAAATGTLYVLPAMAAISYESPHPAGQQMLCDSKGQVGGHLLDLLWKVWVEHASLQLEEAQGEEPVPDGWGSYVEGDFAQIEHLAYQFRKEGHLLVRAGTATTALLTAHESGDTVLGQVESHYELPFGTFDLARVTSEEELQTALGLGNPLITSLVRVKVPRIMYGGPFGRYPWLPDEELLQQLWEIHQKDPDGYAQGTSQYRIDLGSDIGRLFKRPSESYVANLRQRLAASWSPAIWNVFA